MTNTENIDAMVRDFCSLVPRSKSEVRHRIFEAVEESYKAGQEDEAIRHQKEDIRLLEEIEGEIKDKITKEINIAHSENQPTSRLTSLYMAILPLLQAYKTNPPIK